MVVTFRTLWTSHGIGYIGYGTWTGRGRGSRLNLGLHGITRTLLTSQRFKMAAKIEMRPPFFIRLVLPLPSARPAVSSELLTSKPACLSDRNSQIRMYISRTVNYGIRLTPVQTRLWTSIDRLIVPSAVFLASIGITVSTFSVKQLLAAGSRTKRF
ncbi:unnamed protein product [Bemisia tabaci]|uniref:Uncharacterized protein n=1 Tax=Bemisia tabaci TaxID=7038 RepID=A0A9P0F2R9_BEMTA|nr:PREDICTED: uncharacterized protein LOC109037548 isoform X1 [Bemisia tabaci]CAH0385804.1 unnamed protein product [Bemisia tabaci]